MMEREAIEYLIEQGEKVNPIINLEQGTYSTKSLTRVKTATADTLNISTLTGIVDYIKGNTDKLQGDLLIQVKSYDEVRLYSPLNQDRERELYVQAQAILPDNIRYEMFLDTERFNIMLQSGFVDNEDKRIILKYTGLVQDEAVKTTGDDGVSQQVTVKTGVASVGQAIVPNPVTLAPYRTFIEIEQPESKFIFRMQEGPRAALFEADGGAWKNKAILSIKEFLTKELKDIPNIKIIA